MTELQLIGVWLYLVGVLFAAVGFLAMGGRALPVICFAVLWPLIAFAFLVAALHDLVYARGRS